MTAMLIATAAIFFAAMLSLAVGAAMTRAA